MNTDSTLLRPAAAVLAVGGLCWVVKFVVIAATDGATKGLPDTMTGILYLTAVALMALGSGAVAFALTAGRHLVLRAVATVLGVVAWWVGYLLVDSVAQAVIGDSGPTWLPNELGIVVTGALLLTVGAMLARPRSDSGLVTT